MGITKTRPFFCKMRSICSGIYPLRASFCSNLPSRKILLLPLLLTVLFLNGCKTVPIQDRNFSERGGFWEQDENTSFRFHHNAGADDSVVGSMYASGKSALLNGAQVKISAKLKNNSSVSTGPQSSARIEFKASDSSCLIRVDEFDFGNAYADTSDCRQSIQTAHAMIEAENAIFHVHVSQHQTEVTVLSGVIKVTLRNNTTQSMNIRADREISITHDAIGRSYLVTPDEIWQRIRWRDDFQLYKTVIDWETIIAGVVVGVVTIGIIAAAILLSKGHGGGGRGSGFPRHH